MSINNLYAYLLLDFGFLIITFVPFLMYLFLEGHTCHAHMWKLEDNLQDSVLSLHHAV